jgi:hypothetical protein
MSANLKLRTLETAENFMKKNKDYIFTSVNHKFLGRTWVSAITFRCTSFLPQEK